MTEQRKKMVCPKWKECPTPHIWEPNGRGIVKRFNHCAPHNENIHCHKSSPKCPKCVEYVTEESI